MDVGEWIIGLRSNDEEIVDLLRRGLASIRLDDVDVLPNLSLLRGEERGFARELHRLQRRGVTVLRTKSVGRLIRAATRGLEHFLEPLPGQVALRARLLVHDRGAVLLHDAGAELRLSERRLGRMGYRSTDATAVRFDLDTLEVVVPEARFGLDPAVAHEISERWPEEDTEAAVAPGRYPVYAVVLLGTQADHLRIASPARRIASFASLLDTSFHPARATEVEALGRLDGRVRVEGTLGFEADDLLQILRELSRASE